MPRAGLSLVAVLALTALMVLPVGLSPSGSAVRTTPLASPSQLRTLAVGHPVGTPAAAAVQSARESLAAGLGPAAVPFSARYLGAVGPSRAPTWVPSPTEFGRPASAEGWSLLGSLEGHYLGAIAYDAADGYVLEYGGGPDEGSTWSFANGTWTNLSATVTGSPPPRAEGAMVYDATLGSIVVFGGVGFLPNGTGILRNDTWTYRAGAWTNITGSVGPAPEPRAVFGFAYDPNDSADVLFGGQAQIGVAGGTWELAAGHWSNVTASQTTSPPSVFDPAMAEDATDGDVVLFGGGNSSNDFGNFTWTFTGNQWTNVTSTAGAAPSRRAAQTLSSDSSLGGVVMWGGFGQSPTLPVGLSDSWQFVHGAWTPLATTGTPPEFRALAIVSDDPQLSGMLLYGGSDFSNYTFYTDTWSLAADHWSLVTAGASPNPRSGPSMAYDSTTGEVILFGGSGENDTWSYSHGLWSRLTPSRAPPGRNLATLTDDPSDHELVLFGGFALTGGPTIGSIRNDTWVWANGTWTNITATALGPPARAYAAAAYDSTIGQVVLYGGLSMVGAFYDTWTFHGGKWSQVNTTGTLPHASYGMALADDPGQSGVVLFGGVARNGGCPGLGGSYCQQTWTFSGTAWTNRTSTTAPSARAYGGMAYDPAFGEEVLFGGISTVCHSIPNGSECLSQLQTDTWTYGAAGWTNVTSSVGAGPTQTDGATMAYDPTDGYLFLFGAYDGEYSSVGSGDWWGLRSGTTSVALSVGTPTTTVNPVEVLQATTLTVSVTGGAPPYSLSWNGLPGGCSSANSTTLRCVPTAAGPFHITVQVKDSTGATATSAPLLLNVSLSPITLGSVVVAPSAPTVSVGKSVNLTVVAFDTQGHALSGATFAWTAGPGNLGSLNRSTGSAVQYSANASPGYVGVQAAATFGGTTVDGAVTVTVIDATGQPLAIASFTITPSTVAIGATVELVSMASGGTAPYRYAYTGWPAGTCSGNGRFDNCTVEAAGTFVVVVRVTDTSGAVRTANATLTVTGGVASTSTGGLPIAAWIGIGAVVVVVAVVATVLAIRGRRPPPAAPGGPPP